MRIADQATGTIVREFEGEGSPPGTVMWNGTAPSGQTLFIEGGKIYRFWLDLIGEQDDFGRSAPGTFSVGAAADLVVDLQGAFDDAATMRLRPTAPQRVIDTRTPR